MPNLPRIDPRTLLGIYAWYNANYINGFGQANPADGAAIGQWNDLSGNGRHLTQGTGLNQPLFRALGGPSGLNASVQFMDNTDAMFFTNAAVPVRPITIVCLGRNTLADDAAVHRIVGFNADRIGPSLDWLTANVFTANDDAVTVAGGTVPGDITTWHTMSIVARPVGGLTVIGVDGIHLTTAGVAGTNTNSNFDVGIGGVNGWIGHLNEAVCLIGEVPLGVLFAIEQAMAESWGILPAFRVAA